MSSDESAKRYKVSQVSVVRAAHTANNPSKMLEDALSIMDQQIERLRVKSGGQSLDEKEARTLMGYVKGLVEISKEEREREKSDKTLKELEGLSTEDLVKLASEKLKK